LSNLGLYFSPAFGPPTRLPEQGGNDVNTKPFDDLAFVNSYHGQVRIPSVKGVYGIYVLGIEVTYVVGGHHQVREPTLEATQDLMQPLL
jgi:hypothetical protein